MESRIMSFRTAGLSLSMLAATAIIGVLTPAARGQAGIGTGAFFGFPVGVVGGVQVDPHGVVAGAPSVMSPADLEKLQSAVATAQTKDLTTVTGMRKLSLRALYEAVAEAAAENKPLPPEIAFMGGLQRIEYVFVSPKTNDIILAGPAEGWKVDSAGNVVGSSSGCPVIRLEDFIVALRTVEQARTDQGISCSINPTAEGAAALSRLLREMGEFRPEASSVIEKTCGPQTITLTGLPDNSRFAQVLVAADYKMKRLSMGFDEAPIDGMPSYLAMAQKKGTVRSTTSPRFWMECNYQPLARSDDGLTWQLRGSGVKTLVEDGRLAADGTRVATGAGNALSEKWAETMTDNFDALAQREPAFRELRNLMDMSVVAALMAQEGMLEKVGLEMPLFYDAQRLPTSEFHTPKTIPTHCSFVRLTSSWLVTASGGVQIDSWSVVANSEVVTGLSQTRQAALRDGQSAIWWN
jgi:hypothetical protein